MIKAPVTFYMAISRMMKINSIIDLKPLVWTQKKFTETFESMSVITSRFNVSFMPQV